MVSYRQVYNSWNGLGRRGKGGIRKGTWEWGIWGLLELCSQTVFLGVSLVGLSTVLCEGEVCETLFQEGSLGEGMAKRN